MNFCIIPLDLRLEIMQKIDRYDLHNIFLTNEKCFRAYQSETFWKRKVKQEYPDVTQPREISVLELYKRLTLKYGILLTFRLDKKDVQRVPGEYKAIITAAYIEPGITFIIDRDNNLLIFETGDYPRRNLIDKYLGQFDSLDTPLKDDPTNNYIIAKNIRHISGNNRSCFILTTDGSLFQIVTKCNTAMLPNISDDPKNFQTFDVVPVDLGVTDIVSGSNRAYYIKKPGSLYVSDSSTPGFGTTIKL